MQGPIAREAVHEGKKLHFILVVGDGVVASRKLKIHSGLPSPDQARGSGAQQKLEEQWDISNEDSLRSTIALCRGNYAFLQRPGAVLYGNHDGKMLRLAGLLNPEKSPEDFTVDQLNCAVIRLTEKSTVELYWGGTLLLTTHSGRFVVPKNYGEEYITALDNYLTGVFPNAEGTSFHLLAKAVWRFSQKGKGACFVVGTWKNDLEKVTLEMTKVLPFADGLPLLQPGLISRFDDLAEQDGGSIIDAATGCVFGRRQLLPDPQAAQSIREDRPKRPKLYRWGTRHQSAYAFVVGRREKTGEAPKSPVVAIVVSSDGDIHVMDIRAFI